MSDYLNYCQTPRSTLPPYPRPEVHFHHIHTQKFTSTISTLRSSLPPNPHSEVHFHHIHTQKFTSTKSTLRSSLPPYPHSEVHFHHIHTQKFTSTKSTLRSSLPPYPHSEVHFHHIHTQKFTSTKSTLRSSLPPYPHSEETGRHQLGCSCLGAISGRTSPGYLTELPDWHTTLCGAHQVERPFPATERILAQFVAWLHTQHHHEELPGSHPALADHPWARGSQDGRDGAAGVCSQGGKEKGEGNEQDSSPNHAGDPGGTEEGVATPS